MARIILGSYMVRYPLGGMMSWVLQYLLGFQRLGHEVYFVEKSGYPLSCFDPVRNIMTDDCAYGIKTLNDLLERFGLQDQWCYVDAASEYHGMFRQQIESVFRSADLFIDMGTHGSWAEEALGCSKRVHIDGEPGFTQMKLALKAGRGEKSPEYDHYFTTGLNIGTPASPAPSAGRHWSHILHPVDTQSIVAAPPLKERGPFTTVMNWQSYERVTFEGVTYGHKDLEFAKFMGLPQKTTAALEVAVSGQDVPVQELRDAGWAVRDAHGVTISYDAFLQYIEQSDGEFGVCKNGYVALNTGWFSDRSAAYLAMGRPVVLEDTGFREHLPCGRGLFAASSVEEAADALGQISADYEQHSRWARECAVEYLDAKQVLSGFLKELGI